jgi:predicted nuclease with TOPRIM domain
MENEDLIKRFTALEKAKNELDSQCRELQGRKSSLEDRKGQLLASLKPIGINSLGELTSKICELQSSLSTCVSAMETKINSFKNS